MYVSEILERSCRFRIVLQTAGKPTDSLKHRKEIILNYVINSIFHFLCLLRELLSNTDKV